MLGQRASTIQAGPLGNRTILETPFSVGHVDAEQISRTAATTIDAAFNYDASLRSNNSGVASGNTFSVRGQAVDLTFGYKYDGLPFPYWFQDEPIEALSEIQVLKGAGGFVYGYASPSGIVNFVAKRPTSEFQASANLSLRSSSIFRTHIDIGGPFREGGTTAFRLNVVHEEGTLYNSAYNKNDFITLWLQGELVPKLTWSVDGFYQRTWQDRQSNSIALGPNVTQLKPVSGTLNLGAPTTNKLNDVSQVTGRLNYQLDPDWRASVALRLAELDERFPGNTASINDNAGNYTLGLLNQNRLFFYHVGQATLNGRVSTGPVEHSLVGGFDYLDVNFDYDYQPYVAPGRPTTSFNFGLAGNIYDAGVPDYGTNPTALQFQRPPNWFRYEEIRTRGIFFSDTLRLGRAELLVGPRFTTFKDNLFEPVQTSTRYSDSSLTPVAALSYDVAEGARAYASYVQALQRGGIAPATALNVGQNFGPIKSEQYEAGVKAQRSKWSGTLAVYRTTVPAEFVAAPLAGQTLGLFVRDGERRYQGIEAEARYQPTTEWVLNASTSYLDAKQTKAQTAALVGLTVPGVTPFQLSGFVQYNTPYVPGLSLFGGVRHAGKAYAQTMDTFVFSPSTVGDAGVGYVTAVEKNQLQLRANVQNVTNEYYWIPNATGSGLSAGAPRTFTVSIGLATGGRDDNAGTNTDAVASTPSSPSGGGPGTPRSGGFWYLGAETGGVRLSPTTFDVRARVAPIAGIVTDGLVVRHALGWQVGGTLGYDFGLLRQELEISNTYATLNQVKLYDARVSIDGTGRPAGTYDNPGGATKVLAVLLNTLFDVGGNERTPWALQAGVGVGLARVNSTHWQLDSAVPTAFQNDNAAGLAWQALAGIRRRISDRVDLTLKYRFFNVPNLNLSTTNANELDGKLRTHSVQLGTTVNF